ncbi:MAG: helix-turn-helix domain-containing protein [Spirochaetia bacterium]|nr:helix-turn-helix domain-containing protein [Spirochaetia bacterium]
MIQVLDRAFLILEELREREPIALRDLAEKIPLKKVTLFNILKSLVDLGYLAKDAAGRYVLGEKTYSLSRAKNAREILREVGARTCSETAASIEEAVVLANTENLERNVIAESDGGQLLTVSSKLLQNKGFYDTVTGRVLLAWSDAVFQKSILEKNGLPKTEWPEADTKEKYFRALQKIKDESVFSFEKKDLVVYGAPVFSKSGKLVASIGAYVPKFRHTAARGKKIAEALKSAADRIQEKLV